MLEIGFENLADVLIPMVVQALFEMGFHSLASPSGIPPNPWLASLGHALLESLVGGLSLRIFWNSLDCESLRGLFNIAA
jgi:hypothetical protein